MKGQRENSAETFNGKTKRANLRGVLMRALRRAVQLFIFGAPVAPRVS